MRIQNIQAAMRRRPFKPFELHTGSGRSYPVGHPETISASPDTTVVFLIYGPDQTAMIDVDSITEITDDRRKAAEVEGP